MFIDMHVHPAFYEPICDDAEILNFRHSILDIHKNGKAKLEHLYNQMKCAGLNKMCLLPQDYSTQVGFPIVTNEEIYKLVTLDPSHFIGFASVDPFRPDATTILEYAFDNLNLSGLALHPGRQYFYPYDKNLNAIYDICEKYDRPIIFHSGISWEPHSRSRYCRPMEFEELAENRPKLRICLSHFGWPWCQETIAMMLKYPNVYTDTALLYFDSAQEFYDRVFTQDVSLTWIDRSLRHQVMFGSNNPRFEQIRMAHALENLGLRESTIDLIKGQNAIEFLGYNPEEK